MKMNRSHNMVHRVLSIGKGQIYLLLICFVDSWRENKQRNNEIEKERNENLR